MSFVSGERHRRGSAKVSVVVPLFAVCVVLSLSSAHPAWASAKQQALRITQPGGTASLDSGGSRTEFGIAVPNGAACPGDSAHRGFRVDSYLEPATVDPASLTFGTGRADHGYYLPFEPGVIFGPVNTAEGTGQIVDLPTAFFWSRFPETLLVGQGKASSVWNAGLVCANQDGAVTDYWNARITFSASSTDPEGYTWSVDDPLPSPAAGVPWRVIVPSAAAVVFAGIALALYRAERTRTSKSIKYIDRVGG